MGDHEHRPFGADPGQGVDDGRLRDHINLAGRLVQQEDATTRQEGPGQGQALRLPARDQLTALADIGIQALRHPLHLIGHVGAAQGLPQLLIGGPGVRDTQIVGDGAREQPRGLRDAGRNAADLFRFECPQVPAVEHDRSPLGGQSTAEQRQ